MSWTCEVKMSLYNFVFANFQVYHFQLDVNWINLGASVGNIRSIWIPSASSVRRKLISTQLNEQTERMWFCTFAPPTKLKHVDCVMVVNREYWLGDCKVESSAWAGQVWNTTNCRGESFYRWRNGFRIGRTTVREIESERKNGKHENEQWATCATTGTQRDGNNKSNQLCKDPLDWIDSARMLVCVWQANSKSRKSSVAPIYTACHATVYPYTIKY